MKWWEIGILIATESVIWTETLPSWVKTILQTEPQESFKTIVRLSFLKLRLQNCKKKKKNVFKDKCSGWYSFGYYIEYLLQQVSSLMWQTNLTETFQTSSAYWFSSLSLIVVSWCSRRLFWGKSLPVCRRTVEKLLSGRFQEAKTERKGPGRSDFHLSGEQKNANVELLILLTGNTILTGRKHVLCSVAAPIWLKQWDLK